MARGGTTPAQADRDEAAGSEIVDEAQASRAAESSPEQEVDFSRDGRRDNELARLVSQDRLDSGTEGLAPIGDRNEGSRVDDGQSPKAPSSSSSATSAIEPPGP